MKRQRTTLLYKSTEDESEDVADRVVGNPKASVSVKSGGYFLHIDGDKDRFVRLRDMLNELLDDWI